MARIRSRQVETESVNQRMLRRGAVKRQHLTRWAVGHDELAPGVVGDTHLHPSTVERITEVAAGAGVGQLLVVSATGQSFASGGDYVAADSIVYQHGFDEVVAAGDSIVWPVDAVGEIQVEFAWDTYDGGGTIEIEVDGTVPAWGLIGEGTSGSEGCKRRGVHIAEGAVVKVKVTQGSGSAKTGDVLVEFSIPDPSLGVAAGPSLYANVVMADAPVAYWRLGEPSGTTAIDEVGTHSATYAGTLTLGAAGVMHDGSGDTAVDLNGSSGRVTGSDWADLEFAGSAPFSVEAWVELDAFNGSGFNLIAQKQGNAGGDGWELLVRGSTYKELRLGRQISGGSYDAVASGVDTITTATPYYVVGTFDGTDGRLYINGTLVATDNIAGTMAASTAVFSIGWDADASNHHWDGRIDEVAIYGRALTAAEILEHYTVGSAG